jgi:hypothetical protein
MVIVKNVLNEYFRSHNNGEYDVDSYLCFFSHHFFVPMDEMSFHQNKALDSYCLTFDAD